MAKIKIKCYCCFDKGMARGCTYCNRFSGLADKALEEHREAGQINRHKFIQGLKINVDKFNMDTTGSEQVDKEIGLC